MDLLRRFLIPGFSLLMLCSNQNMNAQPDQKLNSKATKKLKDWENPLVDLRNIGKVRIDSLTVIKENKDIRIFFSTTLSYYPFREKEIERFSQSVRELLGRKFRDYKTEFITNGYRLDQLVPNLFRNLIPVDTSRILKDAVARKILIAKTDGPSFPLGLSGNTIALWHSHGYYFDQADNRWKWQRARLFGTVEDISVMGYVLPFLVPMLENSGATVFLPRERDTQVHEVIVDNDRSDGKSEFIIQKSESVKEMKTGFLLCDTLYTGDNPFKNGTSLIMEKGLAKYIPEIPERGSYALYISYPKADAAGGEVNYEVFHTGGSTGYIVDQSMGGGTWIYLGTFHFDSGLNPGRGEVIASRNGGPVLLDAVRFGGGMGLVARCQSPGAVQNKRSVNENDSDELAISRQDSSSVFWKISGMPKFTEGSRYFLQFAGMPDSVYTPNKNRNDYNDDYQSRGIWVNYLTGGSQRQPGTEGPGIPVDLSLAFHTDAGITPGDSVIGTLGIYSTGSLSGKFPDGKSRMASRDLTDIIQTQIVDDIRKTFSEKWVRRGLWDRPYSEARKPDVPAMLLELLSHQNQADQQLGFDPEYKFQVCRSIYKGILRYLCYQENREVIVQPLPVNNFAITPVEGRTIRLSWSPVDDPLEHSARPTGYRIYKRTGDNGFDNGTPVSDPFFQTTLESYDSIYSYKVTATNGGGESFPSEILSVGLKKEDPTPVLVVNGFDRISGPSWFDKAGMAGIAWWEDQGVPYKSAISEVGIQFNFDRNSKWENDDAPGWGASYADREGDIIQGNSFDYPYIHGSAIMAAGHSFYSMSDEYFLSGEFNDSRVKTVDIILGEEKTCPSLRDTTGRRFQIYTSAFMQKIKALTGNGVNFFISGAYLGTDLVINKDSAAIKFAAESLHFKPLTGHAVKMGEVYATDFATPDFTGTLNFNTGISEQIYTVEAPDAIIPAGKGTVSAFRYAETNTGAGVAFRGANKTLVLGFPFETILDETERNRLMREVIGYFEK